MNQDLEVMKKQIKDNIQFLINDNKLDEAMSLIDEYFNYTSEDIEIYSMKAVVFIMQGNMKEAEKILKKGIDIDYKNFDLNYNLAYLYEQENKFIDAIKYYKKALKNCNDENIKTDIIDIVLKIESENDIVSVEYKKKIAFFVKQGMDSFIGDIINDLSDEYETIQINVSDYKQIDEGMEWADICWFEWCDELVAYGSKHRLARQKKIICRLHSYEAFTDYPSGIDWNNIDKLIFISEHIRSFVIEKFNIDRNKTVVITNGIDIKKWSFSDRKVGFNVAYVGYINYKKGPMLLIHTFKAIYDKDHRYKLYIAGQFQDDRDILYFQQMIKEFGIEKNVIYEGWQPNLDEWLEDKNYILCTSILESQNISVMQAMAKGIKPIVHNFVGAKGIYSKEYVWNSIDEAVEMIEHSEYNSGEYRKYITNNYIVGRQLSKIGLVITTLLLEKENEVKVMDVGKLVTIGIINYNYSKYLDQCIQSVLNQTYKNIEIIIIDDCSTDNSIEKIKQYEKKYSNVRGIFHEKNSGNAIRGIQNTISEAKGEYFIMLSADDYLSVETTIYEFLVDLVNDLELDYGYCNLNIVDKNGVYKNVWEYKQYSSEEIINYTFNRGGSGIIPMTAGLYKTDFYRKNKMNWYDDKDNTVAGDTLNSLVYIKYNFKCKHINRPLISYRHHDSNITYDLRSRIKSIISVLEYIINNFSEEIYLKEISWNDFKFFNNRQSKKMYLIGVHYMNVLKNYNNSEFKVWEGSETKYHPDEIRSYIKPLALKVKQYLERSLGYSDEYELEIRIIMVQIQQILE